MISHLLYSRLLERVQFTKKVLCWLLIVIGLRITVVPTTNADLFVSEGSDRANSDSILRFSPNGAPTSIASGLSFARGLAFDGEGNLFAADYGSGSIFKFTPSGIRSTFASGEGLARVVDVAFDSAGNLFVSKQDSDGSIVRFTPIGTRSTFASGLSFPGGLAFDAAGNLFVSEVGTDRVLKFTSTGVQSIFACGLRDPNGLTFDSAGNLFAADESSGKILKFSPSGSQSTFATVVQPVDLLFDNAGNLYVSDSNGGFLNDGGFIYKFDPNGMRSTFATGLDPTFLAFQPIPEPSVAVFGLGLVVIWLARRHAPWRRTVRRIPARINNPA